MTDLATLAAWAPRVVRAQMDSVEDWSPDGMRSAIDHLATLIDISNAIRAEMVRERETLLALGGNAEKLARNCFRNLELAQAGLSRVRFLREIALQPEVAATEFAAVVADLTMAVSIPPPASLPWPASDKFQMPEGHENA